MLQTFEAEKQHLLALPEHRFPAWERLQVSIPKTPYARFDGNDYSVPASHVQTIVEVCADEKKVLIFANEPHHEQIAEHDRSYGKQETIEIEAHIQEVLKRKRAASSHAGLNKVHNEVPSSMAFLQRLAERGENLGGAVSSLLNMLRNHGGKMVETAVAEVVAKGSCTLRSVHFVLSRLEQRGKMQPMPSAPMANEQHANLTVKHHDPKIYDEITGITQV